MAGMGTPRSITVAYQTLTPEAQALSERKSISVEGGNQLLQMATERKIPVYTDLIWGLPGESYHEFLNGLEKVHDIGIQNISIFPLEVIPGTRYYEEKEKFGLETLESDEHSQELVLSHPKMSIKDQQKGIMVIHAHHMLHTLKICHSVNRYLDLTFGVKYSQLCDVFLSYAEIDNKRVISAEAELLRQKIFKVFTVAGGRHGANLDESINMIAYAFWDHWQAAEELFLDFYQEFFSTSSVEVSTEQWQEIQELLRFNILIAPKPGWSSKEAYLFTYDVGRFYQEIMRHWGSAASTNDIPKLEKRSCSYRFVNSFHVRPKADNTLWIRNAIERMCRFEEVVYQTYYINNVI